MKIYIVSNGYPSEKYNINGIFQFDQAKALAARGHEIIYLAVDLRSIRRWRKWGFESLIKDNVKIEAINIPLGRFPRKILYFNGIVGLSWIYKRAIRKYGDPEIIHAHFTDSAYYALRALSKTNIPIVMTEHSSAINQEFINVQDKRIASYSYGKADAVFAVSPVLQQKIKQIFGIDSKYIPNIVDLELFRYKGVYEKSEPFLIVTAGNLIPLKRMHRLVEGFAEFIKSQPNSELIIFGEGPERVKLEEQIHDLGLAGKVKMEGNCKRSKIAQVLHQADCFVLASSSETFGVVYIEALACGVPVIATRCGGPEGFVHDGNGILIPVDDEKALQSALLKMYMNIESYDRLKIASEIQEMFSPDNVLSQLEKFYHSYV